MKKYTVDCEGQIEDSYTVMADNEDEARDKAEDLFMKEHSNIYSVDSEITEAEDV